MTTLRLLSLLLGLLGVTEAVGDILYKARLNEQTIWVMGTLHAAEENRLTLSDTARQAIDNSEEIWLEAHPDDLANAGRVFAQKARRQTGALSDSLNKATSRSLHQRLSDYGLNFDTINQMQAWFVQVVLVAQAVQQSGFAFSEGIENTLIQHLQHRPEDIRGLETIERQIQALKRAQHNVGEQELIQQALEESDQVSSMMKQMQSHWLAGDLDRLAALLNAHLPKKAKDALIITRNREWLQRLIKDASTDTLFVAVGAAHLPGEQGLLKLLARQGATVDNHSTAQQ